MDAISACAWRPSMDLMQLGMPELLLDRCKLDVCIVFCIRFDALGVAKVASGWMQASRFHRAHFVMDLVYMAVPEPPPERGTFVVCIAFHYRFDALEGARVASG